MLFRLKKFDFRKVRMAVVVVVVVVRVSSEVVEASNKYCEKRGRK